MNSKKSYTRWKMKLQKAKKALREDANTDTKHEVEWCLRHVEQYKILMAIESTDKRKLKGQHRSI